MFVEKSGALGIIYRNYKIKSKCFKIEGLGGNYYDYIRCDQQRGGHKEKGGETQKRKHEFIKSLFRG